MTNKYILNTALRQSAVDLSCDAMRLEAGSVPHGLK